MVIVGFGHNGQALAQILTKLEIQWIALDLNPDTVVRAKRRGLSVAFGDAQRTEVLDAVYVNQARAAVVAISDAQRTQAIIRAIRARSKNLPVVVRTAFAQDVQALQRAGEAELVVAELETAVELAARVLGKLNIPQEQIESTVRSLQADTYRLLR